MKPSTARAGASSAEEAVRPPQAEEEFAGNRRELRRWEALVLAALCVGFTLFHLFVLNVYSLEPLMFRAVHVAWGGAIGFLLYAVARPKGRVGIAWYDWILAAASVACGAYVVYEIDGLLFRAGAQWTFWDVVVGFLGTLLVFEFGRRTSGLAMVIIAGVFLLYCFAGPWLPGVLEHRGYPFGHVFTYMYSEYGMFGVTTQVSSSYIILFVCFAAFLRVSGVGEYINDLCNSLFGWARGGPAKAAVASGALFGSISGSSVANVVASGMVTIPMMRRVGYDRATAGAIEATSSTGGQITPPVLGAGAFLMAEITGIPYSQIALAAVLPAFLFYVACWVHVDYHAVRLGLRGLARAELPPLNRMLMLLYLFSPIVVLVWALMEGYSPFRAGGLGILAALVAGWLSGLFRDLGVSLKPAPDSPAAVLAALLLRLVALVALGGLLYGALVYGSQLAAAQFGDWTGIGVGIALVAVPAALFGWKRTLHGLNLAARDTIQLVAVCAVAGVIVGVVALTGIGGRFSEMILGIAGANQLLAMAFVAVVALILGMGMPTTAAYAIGAAVLAPGLRKIGVEPLVAHFFIFYFAVLSAITPPVALASFAAAGMAQADPWKTSWTALKMGLATFLVPFMFYFSPILLWKGSALDIVQAAATGAIGVWFLASSTEGWFGGRLAWPLRAVMFAAALCLIHPGSVTDLAGFALGAPVYLWQRLRRPMPSSV